jgi:uncharacterized membrane protein
MTTSDSSASAWTRTYYPRHGDGVAFDRVVFFCDAVFAIALTLAAVEIGIPEVDAQDASSVHAMWEAIQDKLPGVFGFLVAFGVVAFYWRANHRFTITLRGMDRAYVGAVILYLGLISLLPLPAAMLGEYTQNPLAVTVFALYASAASGMEVVLFLVADRRGLFVAPLSPAFRRQQLLGSLMPLAIFLTSIPLAFVNTAAAMGWWVVGSVGAGFMLSRLAPAQPPDDDAGPAEVS